MELVKNEMDWTINCFERKEGMWKKIAEDAERGGHKAYAWKQSWMWGGWARAASATFKALTGVQQAGG